MSLSSSTPSSPAKNLMMYTLLLLLSSVACTGHTPDDSGTIVTDSGQTTMDDTGIVRVPVSDASCGAAAPTHAPAGCGVQQWGQYSAHIPDAVGWLAIANTGTGTCKVSGIKLELSYSTASGSTVLANTVYGAQDLYDGTSSDTSKTFGTKKSDDTPTTAYTIAASPGYYVHPFTQRKKVPTNATKVTLKYSITLGTNCVVEAGIDTYQEDKNPTTAAPYTTDTTSISYFIKEAYKTAWSSSTVSNSSFSITRHMAPQSLTAAACYDDVQLTWSAPSDETAIAYSIFHATSTFDPASYDPDVPAATAWKSTTSTSQTDTGLGIGTTEYYGAYSAGTYTYAPADDLHSALAITSVTPAKLAWAAPTTGSYSGAGSIMLYWKSATSMVSTCATFIKSYTVEQGEVSSSGACTVKTTFSDPIDWTGTAESATQMSGIGGLTTGKKYCFDVAAYLSDGSTTNKSATVSVVAP